jgi:hypothetical protein
VTEFAKKIPYRLLGTATAAPNDYIELGTSSEAIGVMGYIDMLNRFFKNDQNTSDTKKKWRFQSEGATTKWRFKKHAKEPFWRWVCSWARTCRKPSDLGFNDKGFDLPPLVENEIVLPVSRPVPGKLFVEPAASLKEQREERRITMKERCEEAAKRVEGKHAAVVWCHLNDEGDLLKDIIPDAVQIKGSATTIKKQQKREETFINFINGDIRVLITKPKIAGFGLNFQHCNHMTTFPSHSWEQYYQSTRRFWRFGQKKTVKVDIITTAGEHSVLNNLRRKAIQADKMFDNLVRYMNEGLSVSISNNHNEKVKIPSWL